jgi:hypothetical protein
MKLKIGNVYITENGKLVLINKRSFIGPPEGNIFFGTYVEKEDDYSDVYFYTNYSSMWLENGQTGDNEYTSPIIAIYNEVTELLFT